MSPNSILLVEDNAADRELTLRELRSNGLANEIVVKESGEAALDYLFAGDGTSRTLPLVMILDLRLPVVDGIDVLRRVRTDPRTQDLPVMVLTGSSEDVDAMQTYALRASNFFQKPLTFTRFKAAAEKLGLLKHLDFG